MPAPTHAFVGRLSCGKALFVEADLNGLPLNDAQHREDLRQLFYRGGRLERVPLEEARAIGLCLGECQCQPPKSTVAISGVWVRTAADGTVQVLVERDRKWRIVEGGPGPGPTIRVRDQSHSHIVEVAGIERAPVDDLTEVEGETR